MPDNPETDYPSLFMMVSEHFQFNTPKKCKRNQLQVWERSLNPKRKRGIESEDELSEISDTCEDDPTVYKLYQYCLSI